MPEITAETFKIEGFSDFPLYISNGSIFINVGGGYFIPLKLILKN